MGIVCTLLHADKQKQWGTKTGDGATFVFMSDRKDNPSKELSQPSEDNGLTIKRWMVLLMMSQHQVNWFEFMQKIWHTVSKHHFCVSQLLASILSNGIFSWHKNRGTWMKPFCALSNNGFHLPRLSILQSCYFQSRSPHLFFVTNTSERPAARWMSYSSLPCCPVEGELRRENNDDAGSGEKLSMNRNIKRGVPI